MLCIATKNLKVKSVDINFKRKPIEDKIGLKFFHFSYLNTVPASTLTVLPPIARSLLSFQIFRATCNLLACLFR